LGVKKVRIINLTHPLETPIIAGFANLFFEKLRGLMFRKSIAVDEGLLLFEGSESRINTSIHMLFMNFDITAIWINASNEVVDVKLARKWHLAYLPNKPASAVLETHPAQFHHFWIRDKIVIQDV
jgi:uncharacterized membrane protein (UPF0127 family)